MKFWMGAVAGGFHAVTGIDHLAALLPLSIGKGARFASRYGLIWGAGHGIGASLMGFIAVFFKSYFDITAWANLMELCVGLTLCIIGAMGISKWKHHKSSQSKVNDWSSIDIESRIPSSSGFGGPRLVLWTGIFHGFSGTGHLVGVLPSLTFDTMLGSALYLLTFCLGTMLTMGAFTAFVGEIGNMISVGQGHSKQVHVLLSFYASVLAIAIGLVWIVTSTDGIWYSS